MRQKLFIVAVEAEALDTIHSLRRAKLWSEAHGSLGTVVGERQLLNK